MKRFVLLAVIVGALVAAAPAGALIEPGNIGALPSNPYPTQPGVVVNGTLFTNQPLGPGGTPQDYLKFTVARAGETIEFTDQNTTTGLNPNRDCSQFCPVYLSLVGGSDPQHLMGLGDGSGTIATYGNTEVFDWTFSAPGTYYMVMESNGDVNLSYAEDYRIVSGGTGSGPTTSPPLVRKLHVAPKQSGMNVNAYLTLGQWLPSVRVALLYGKHLKTIAALNRAPLGPGRHHFKLALPAAYQRTLKAGHKLSLVVRLTVRGKSGVTQTFNRRVTLTS